MNVRKTKLRPPDETMTIKVGDANLKQVIQFKYLGTQITDDARTTTELEFKMSIANAEICFDNAHSVF